MNELFILTTLGYISVRKELGCEDMSKDEQAYIKIKLM